MVSLIRDFGAVMCCLHDNGIGSKWFNVTLPQALKLAVLAVTTSQVVGNT